jgi:hypothetical protein
VHHYDPAKHAIPLHTVRTSTSSQQQHPGPTITPLVASAATTPLRAWDRLARSPSRASRLIESAG